MSSDPGFASRVPKILRGGAVLIPVFVLGIVALFMLPTGVQNRWVAPAMVGLAGLTVVQIVLGVLGLFTPGWRIVGLFSAVAGGVELCFSLLFLALAAGGGWGRPLRIRGRQIHPELRGGSDWTRGPRPDPSALDPATRRALEALWLHDAQKEHASVPAFARVSWLLAAVGAPADLLEWSHRAALEEIEHTRLCFALAAGYAGRSHSVRAMPELLSGALDDVGDPLRTLATESLSDGCQLEDFNADVAAECARVCEEPATRAVLEQIAQEERSHADFSWAVLEWLVAHDPGRVLPALDTASRDLDRYRRPTAVAWQKKGTVAAADPVKLRAHGRLPDERWAELWAARLRATRSRVVTLGRKAA